MDNPGESNNLQNPQDQNNPDIFYEPIHLGSRALQAMNNLQWEEAKKLSEQAQAKANLLEGQEGEFVRGMTAALTTMLEGVAVQIRDSDQERFQRATQHFETAKNTTQELMSRFPDKRNPGFEQFLTDLKLQAIWAERTVALQQGDRQRAMILGAQYKAMIDEIPEEAKRNQYQGLVALLHYQEIMDRIKEGTASLVTMDLARALGIIAEVRKEAGDLLTVIKPSLGKGVLF